jgi:RND family efflux transporter MFP subunit
VRPGPLPKVFRAPGEVRTNDYSTNSVTARHQAIVAERKAKLGEKVTKGQPLVGLFSAEMAEAQTAYVLAVQEYRRVQQLGRDVVAARRFNEADGKRRETRAKLETFGLASAQIDTLAANGRSDHPAGQFDIVAPQAGTIVSDDFRLGAVVEPGKVLFVITNPDNVWIEAHVSPSIATEIAGQFAKVHAGNKQIVARVVQVQQQIDESTRTIGVRLEAESADGTLKPGLFVDVELYGKAEQVMSLPTDAIVRGPDGDWTIYVENAKGAFEPKEIETLYTVGARTVISGVAPGTKVVTSGAFFVMAEAAKAGFDPHGH